MYALLPIKARYGCLLSYIEWASSKVIFHLHSSSKSNLIEIVEIATWKMSQPLRWILVVVFHVSLIILNMHKINRIITWPLSDQTTCTYVENVECHYKIDHLPNIHPTLRCLPCVLREFSREEDLLCTCWHMYTYLKSSFVLCICIHKTMCNVQHTNTSHANTYFSG